MNYAELRHKLKKRLNKEIMGILKDSKAFIAGGACLSLITGDPISDYDLYFESKEDRDKCYALMMSDLREEKTVELISTDNAVTLKMNGKIFQLINTENVFGKWECIRSTIAKFDFNLIKIAYDVYGDCFIFVDEMKTIFDIAQRRLTTSGKLVYPMATMVRINKYLRKGYKVPNLELIKISMQTNKLNISDLKELKKQLCGVDMVILSALLNEMENMNFDSIDDMKQYFIDAVDTMFGEINTITGENE